MTIRIIKDIADRTEAEVQAAIDQLPPWRREQALKFKFKQGRAECAFSYLLLCAMLRDEYGITHQPAFEVGEHGKPSLAGLPHIHFNLSHCKAGIACAISTEGPIGIDIECVGRFSDSLARYTLNDEEYQHVTSSQSPDTEFTRYWTKKEAVVKLSGRGIDDDVKDILKKSAHVCVKTFVHLDAGYAYSYATYDSADVLAQNVLK